MSLIHNYHSIISVENLLEAWKEFIRDKKKRKDTQNFERNLMSNIFSLHHDLKNKTYIHGGYEAFKVNDPKPRDIHKASVRDRLLHHAIYRVLYPYFDTKFIHDSYSCRVGKGTHKAIDRFREFFHKVSKNNTRQCWVLKCDIRKFFASIDHDILKEILAKHISDEDILWLLDEVISSFQSTGGHPEFKPYHPELDSGSHTRFRNEFGMTNRGLPLGNLTSQLLVNIYMNEFGQFVKYTLKQKYYIRYADDFVFLSHRREELEQIKNTIASFLKETLRLELHPDKVFIKTYSSGVDFLGWVHFSSHRALRTSTKRRMIKKVNSAEKDETVQSYLGMLSHGNSYELSKKVQLIFERFKSYIVISEDDKIS
ncbi:MAG: group II intron reverse transcriptase domain-containing protein [Candidatus Pacebacteria bacterium]|nr:group II intron reverse transcriptase domain-containing protein [Candidatus Paceibacterota bacterium]